MILALVNNKGGVAKTTTAVSLAAGLADTGQRVLLVDLDGQASASLSLGIPRNHLSPSSADMLFDALPAETVRRQTGISGLELITGTPRLANSDLILAGVKGREWRLRDALSPLVSEYAFIVLDCPPSLSLLSVNALAAADSYLVPVVPQYLALEGLVGLFEAVEQIRRRIGSKAELLGVLLTLVDYRTRAAREIVSMIREHYGPQVLQTEIRINTRLAEAPSFGQTIFVHDPNSTGAQAYGRLTQEILARTRSGGKEGPQ